MEATGMQAVVTSITTALSAANLWEIVGTAVPIIAIGVLFGLGFRIVKKVVKGLSNGKAKM